MLPKETTKEVSGEFINALQLNETDVEVCCGYETIVFPVSEPKHIQFVESIHHDVVGEGTMVPSSHD